MGKYSSALDSILRYGEEAARKAENTKRNPGAALRYANSPHTLPKRKEPILPQAPEPVTPQGDRGFLPLSRVRLSAPPSYAATSQGLPYHNAELIPTSVAIGGMDVRAQIGEKDRKHREDVLNAGWTGAKEKEIKKLKSELRKESHNFTNSRKSDDYLNMLALQNDEISFDNYEKRQKDIQRTEKEKIKRSNEIVKSEAMREYSKLRALRINSGETAGILLPENPAEKSGIDYLAESATAGFKKGAEGLWNAGVDFVAASQRRGTEQAIEDLEGYADMDAVKKLVDETVIKVNKNAVSARSDESSKIEKELAGNYYASGAYKIAGDVSNGVGGLLPTLAANSIIPGAGMPALFVSSAGNAAMEARKGGADEDTAAIYGVLSGCVEAATEKMFAGIPGLNKSSWLGAGVEETIQKAISKLAFSDAGKFLIKKAADILGEGFEEFISEYAGAFLKKMYDETARNEHFGETLKNTWADAWYSFLIGALSSATMNTTAIKLDYRNYSSELNANRWKSDMEAYARQQNVNSGTSDALRSPVRSEHPTPSINAQMTGAHRTENSSQMVSLSENSQQAQGVMTMIAKAEREGDTVSAIKHGTNVDIVITDAKGVTKVTTVFPDGKTVDALPEVNAKSPENNMEQGAAVEPRLPYANRRFPAPDMASQIGAQGRSADVLLRSNGVDSTLTTEYNENNGGIDNDEFRGNHPDAGGNRLYRGEAGLGAR
ncbi:MAG: hypothetical protein RSG53_06980, partial [Oscillospiraceae bacterium]